MRALIIHLATLCIAAISLSPAFAAVNIVQQPDQSFDVTTPVYVAVVARSGLITSLKMGNMELLNGPVIFGHLGQQVKVAGAEQTDASTIKVSFLDYQCPLTYVFNDGDIQITAHNLAGSFDNSLGASITLSNHAQLVNGNAMPCLNAFKATAADFKYDDGSVLHFSSTGPGNPFNDGENGNCYGMGWARRMFNPTSVYHITLSMEKGAPNTLVLSGPPFTLTTGKQLNLFLSDEPVTITASFAKQYYNKLTDRVKNTYLEVNVKDIWGNTVDTENINVDFNGDDPLQVPITIASKRKGCFSLSATIKDKANILTPTHTTIDYAVVTRTEGLTNPPFSRQPSDFELDSFMGLKCERESISLKDICPTDYFTKLPPLDDIGDDMQPTQQAAGPNWDQTDAMMNENATLAAKYGVTTFYLIDSVPKWLMNNPTRMEDVLFTLISRYKDKNKYWMLFNEPNLAMSPEAYVKNYLGPLYRAAHRADPDAKVMGPDCCGINPAYLANVYKAGGKSDIVDMHPYTGHNRCWEEQGIAGAWRDVRKVMDQNGTGDQQIWSTESGFSWDFNKDGYLHHATCVVRQYPIAESVGIPKQHFMYYYTSEHGFINFYLVANDHFIPGGIAARVESEQLIGKQQTKEIPIGPFKKAYLFTGLDEDVVMAWSLDFPTRVNLSIASKKFTVVDMMGNVILDQSQTSANPRNVTIELSGSPVYIHIDHGGSIRDPEDTGPDIALASYWTDQGLAAPVVTASSEDKGAPASRVIDGIWDSENTGSFEGLLWTAAESIITSKGAWLEIDLPKDRPCNAIYICGPSDNCGMTSLRTFTVDVFDAEHNTWKQVGSVSNSEIPWIFEVKFPTIATSKIKIQIADVNNGFRLGDKTPYTDMKPHISEIEAFDIK